MSIILILLLNSFNILPAQSNQKGTTAASSSSYDLGPPPGKYLITSENKKVIIPFEFYKNKFRFKAQINGKDCNMMLDNGTLWDELLFFGSPKVDSFGFNFTEETSIGMTKADVDTNTSIRVKDVIFNKQKAVVSRYEKDRPNLWEGFDGQFSATFFKHFVVKINFDESIIELIPPDSFKYSGSGQEFEMKIGPFNTRTIAAEVTLFNGTIMTIDLLIDIGGLHPLYLPIGKHDKITLPSNAIEVGLGKGLFNQKGYMGRVKSVRFGDYVLKDVLTAFTVVDKEADIFGNTMIGLLLLRRFNLVFDYFNNRIILEPSKSFDESFIFNTTGLEFFPDKQGNLKVRKVYPNSPASEAGIEVEDIITQINRISINEFKHGEIKALLMNEEEIIELKILRKNTTQLKKITLRDVL
jgi:hypothetical protein